jgi:quaternary ammonium compound-resistance protein SugE
MSPSFLNASHAWLLLAVAGILEVAWAVGMKYTEGFTRWGASIAVLAIALLSFWLLGLAMRVLPVGTAYAVWVGIGAAGAGALGIVLFGEPANAARIGCIALIVAGVIGLKLVEG